jgi:hypothetical protein
VGDLVTSGVVAAPPICQSRVTAERRINLMSRSNIGGAFIASMGDTKNVLMERALSERASRAA